MVASRTRRTQTRRMAQPSFGRALGAIALVFGGAQLLRLTAPRLRAPLHGTDEEKPFLKTEDDLREWRLQRNLATHGLNVRAWDRGDGARYQAAGTGRSSESIAAALRPGGPPRPTRRFVDDETREPDPSEPEGNDEHEYDE